MQWNEVTKGWNKVVWNEVVMERSGRNLYFLLHCMMPMVLPSLNQNHFFYQKKPHHYQNEY